MNQEAPDPMALALDWVYVPDGAREVRTEDFHLVAYPESFVNPTAVFRIDSPRPAAELVDAALAAAAGLDRHDVTFWTHPAIRPGGLVDELVGRGAMVEEELAVLALPLAELPDLDEPELDIRLVDDLATIRDDDRIGVAVFGETASSDDELMARLDRRSVTTGLGWVAYWDGAAVGMAGATVRDDALRLWGAATLPEARGTGVYRALLAHRLRHGVEHGCTTALVTGRLTTSAPILLRAGFAHHGEQTSYRLLPADG